MELTWLGAAMFKGLVGSTVFYLDPFLDRPKAATPRLGLTTEDIDRADYIFCSHGHFDHVADVPEIAARTGARVFAPSKVCQNLYTLGVPDNQLRPVQSVETIGLQDFRVRVIPSAHVRFDWALIRRKLGVAWRLLPDLGKLLRYPSGQVVGYLFTGRRCSWCFFGSAGYRTSGVEGLAPDLALLPVQGRRDIYRFTAQRVATMEPKWLIPHHFDDFYPPLSEQVDLEPLLDAVDNLAPATQVLVPQAGQRLRYQQGKLIAG
jgi:L-ascorbate metabolism protein UlaG (beta-lactamase superfamily)